MNQPARRQRGFSMIEVLVTILVVAFGLLSLAGFVAKATTLTSDAGQRARAVSLLNDMASRIANNKLQADSYVTGAAQGSAVQACAAGMTPAIDICQWNNLLAGAQDASSGTQAAFLGFRGCVTRPNPVDPVYIVTVAWGSMAAGVPPADTCGQNAFGDDSLRRVVRTQVRIAALAA